MQSASRPLSNDELKKQREKRNAPQGKLDKNGNTLKFCQYLESDWPVKNDPPHFWLKEHTAVMTLQNGLGNVERIAEVVGSEHVVGGTTAQGATLLGDGHVRHAGNGETVIGKCSFQNRGPTCVEPAGPGRGP